MGDKARIEKMKNITLEEVIKEYEKELDQKSKSSFKSAFLKFGYACLGFERIKAGRLSKEEIRKAEKNLAKRKIEELDSILNRLEELEEFKKLQSNSKRQNRYHIKNFIKWVEKKYEVKKLEENKEKKIKEIKLFEKCRQAKGAGLRKTEQKKQERLILTEKEVPKEELERIEKELNGLKQYITRGLACREITAEKRVETIRRIIGWWYRNNKVEDIKQLSLEAIIPCVKLKYTPRECKNYEEYILKEGIAKHECKDKAKEIIDIVETEYFPSLKNDPRPRTKEYIYDCLIVLAKYIYKKETDIAYGDNFEDIPIIQYLRVQRKKSKEKRAREEKPTVTWEEVMYTLEVCRQEALTESIRYDRKDQKGIRRNQRTKTAIASSYQRFLILGFLTLMPPDRQRTVRELQIGKTLKYGEFINNRYREYDPTKDKGKKWYIHLKPEDYKTGEAYGEWRGEIPNVEFNDGSKFYEYIHNWLYEGIREELNPKDKSYLFCKERSGEKLKVGDLWGLIVRLFNRLTGVPINPHQLRHIYATYLRDLGVTDIEKEAAAYWMKHSRETADKVYSHQSIESKLEPVYSLIEKTNYYINQ